MDADSEQALENTTLALFAELGWETVNGYYEVTSETPDAGTGGPHLGRATRGEVVLRPRLEAALTRINPNLPPEPLQQAIEELTRDRSAMTLIHANREVYALLKDGVQVTFRDPDGEERIAEDIVQHFIGRGYLGKAMVVSIDKLTTVRMYDKVSKYWRGPSMTCGHKSPPLHRGSGKRWRHWKRKSPLWKEPTWRSSSPRNREKCKSSGSTA